MESTEVFIVLPEYRESAIQTGHYLQSEKLFDDNEISKYIHKIEIFNDFFTHENYQAYYDVRNIVAFSLPLEEIEECYPNQKTYLRSVLREWENWRETPLQCEKDTYRLHSCPIADDSFCEIAKRQTLNPENAYLLINHQAFECKKKFIEIDCNDVKLQVMTCHINIRDVAEWFTCYRKPQRIYNWNPKHGENGKRAHPENKGDKVSTLLCSKEEAYELLKKAIGIYPHTTLFYYDRKHLHYMEFKKENAQTFHSFHIEDESRVPKSIKEKILYLISESD